MKEQGCLVECVYCKYIRPDLQGKSTCPKCQGNTLYFQTAQMMDKPSAANALLSELWDNLDNWGEDEQREFLLNWLKKIDIYQFNLKDAIIYRLKILEQTS